MKSILHDETSCYICGSTRALEEHHIFGGHGNRTLSEQFGLKVKLCHWCHNEPPDGAHHNKETADFLHREGQKAFEQTHSREEFMQKFGRNYL